ncbi:MAG: orotate phosphoribosyltransferase [bacterium]
MEQPSMDARERLRALLLAHSVRWGEFTLASGKKSDLYVDARVTLMLPEGLSLAGRLLLDLLDASFAPGEVDALGGMAVGAVPLVSACLVHAADHSRWRQLRGFFVRKEAKGHGLGKRVEGAFRSGDRVVLLEDVVTSGGSSKLAADAVREAGGEVRRVLAILDRDEGGAAALADSGGLAALFHRADLVVPR